MPFSFFQRKTITPSQTKEKKEKNTQKLSFVDNRSNSSEISDLQNSIDNSDNSQSITQLQEKVDNKTGMPDDLKQGVENLSGEDMSDVKVTYNSDKPAQLQAHAYAVGNNIHIAPGQEKHLPHEAWHVVQQKQGRVQPTMQMKGNVNVNDDAGLEKEADVMGQKALQLKSQNLENLNNSTNHSMHTFQLAKGGVVGGEKAESWVPTVDNTRNTKMFQDFMKNVANFKSKNNLNIPDSVFEEIWETALKKIHKTQGTSIKGKVTKEDGSQNEGNFKPRDIDDRFSHDFASATYGSIIQEFEPLKEQITSSLGQTFNSTKKFGFWSKNPAMEVGKQSGAMMLETSALGSLFDGLNLAGNWNIELWAALSKFYAEAVASKITKDVIFWGFVGPGALADVGNIYSLIESKTFVAIGQKHGVGNASEKITWFACVPNINDAGEMVKEDNTTLDDRGSTPSQRPEDKKSGIQGVTARSKDRNEVAKIADEVTKQRKNPSSST